MVVLVGGVVASYFRLGLLEDSPVQAPEKLYRDKGLMTAVALCCIALAALMFIDVPVIYEMLSPQLRPLGR